MRGWVLNLSVMALCASASGGMRDLRFIAGTWRGEQGGSVIEEHWMAPEGDAIVGVARVVSGGKIRQTELSVMEERDGGVVLMVRHFGRGQVAREEKDAPLLFTLKELVGRRAEFVEGKSGTRLVYERTPFEYRKR